jgi:hypothetical protein
MKIDDLEKVNKLHQDLKHQRSQLEVWERVTEAYVLPESEERHRGAYAVKCDPNVALIGIAGEIARLEDELAALGVTL